MKNLRALLAGRSTGVSVVLALIVSLAGPAFAGSPKQTTPPVGVKAGSVSALLPVAKIYRGAGRNQVSLDAKKGDDVSWNDTVRTEKGGRARITLNDQSVLSLGSQAELKIVKHDARTQQTSLQLGYGRLRAEVASVTRDGGKFELRTPTAVAGVIGTDFGTDSSVPGTTTFLCISGVVEVGSSDPALPGTVPCSAGNTVSVTTGNKPTQPKPATPQQIQQLIQDTEPAVISAVSPASALQGVNLTAAVTGTKMTGINAVSVSGSGVSAAVQGTSTDSAVNISLNVAANAAPGPRTITFTKANGQTSAAVFTILAPPSGTQGPLDVATLKKSYDDIIEQERLSEIAGINAILVGVQQSASQGSDQVTQANGQLNPALSLSTLPQDYSGPIATLVQQLQQATNALNNGAQMATSAFNGFADAAANKGGGDDVVKAAIKTAFDNVNKQLLDGITQFHASLNGPAVSANQQIAAVTNRWLDSIKKEADTQARNNTQAPTPQVAGDDKQYEVGFEAELDGSRSSSNNASIASYNWVLCSPNYKPAQTGVLLPANAPGCSAISGFGSSSADFKFQTCSLAPQDYIARLTITDSNGKSSAVDARIHVMQPSYDDPSTRVKNLAAAMQSLQPSQFLSYFDDSYSGITQLQENIRRTFSSLASMNINLRISQASIDCSGNQAGTATVRADWDQSYTFVQDHTCDNIPQGQVCNRVVFNQTEQLTMRMNRVPGKGWFITDFQGDSGTVQGTPPGPIQTDAAVADLQVTDVSSTTGGTGIPPGPYSFTATVTNTGNGDLANATAVHFSLRDATTNNEIASSDANVPTLAHGASTQIQASINVPDLGTQVNANLSATVNPSCTVAEKSCGNNTFLRPVVVGSALPDLRTTNVAFSLGGTSIPPGNDTFTATVQNVGTAAFATPANVKFSLVDGNGTEITSALVPITVPMAGGASQQISGTLNVPDLGAGVPAKIVANANPGCSAFERNCDAQNIFTLNVTLGTVDLALSNLRSTGSLIGTQSGTVLVDIRNLGTRASVPSTGNLVLSGTSGVIGTGNIPSIPVGSTVTVPLTFIVPNVNGTMNVTLAVNPPSAADTNASNDSTSGSINITAGSLDLSMGALRFTSAGLPPFLSGQSRGVIFTLTNTGNVPTNSADTYSCQLAGSSTVTLVPATAIAPIAANSSATITANFTVPANMAGSDTISCAAVQDPLETNAANNTASIAALVNSNIDLTLVSVPAPPVAFQMGSSQTLTFGVQNIGGDTAPAGANVVLMINGSQVATTTLSSIAAGATQSVTLTYTVPQLGAAPQDTTVPGLLIVNQNAAVTETNTANDSSNQSFRLVDFTVAAQGSNFQVIAGRSASFGALSIGVVNSPYPLPITVTYSGVPPGLTPSGTNNVNLAGTVSGSPGTSIVSANAVVSGVTHNSGSFNVNVGADFTITQTSSPTLAAASGGGPAGTITFSVSGGVYPATFQLGSLATGITLSGATPATQTLTGPGTISWQIGADITAPVGALTTTTAVNDSGISATGVPSGSRAETTTYAVAGNVDLFPTITLTNAPNKSGQVQSFTLRVSNNGNSTSAASDQYTCTFNGNTVSSGGVPQISGGSSTNLSLSFTIPADSYLASPVALSCSTSADPGESGAALSNNTASTSIAVVPNFDLAITSMGSIPTALQQGQNFAVNVTVTNQGTDTAPAGWSDGITIAGTAVATGSSRPAIAPGGTFLINNVVTVPSPNGAPSDVTYTNGYVANITPPTGDTNSADDVLAANVRLADFTIAAQSSSFNVIVGRSANIPALNLNFINSPYPVTLQVTYSGLPAGLSASGTNNTSLTGTVFASPNTYNVQGTANAALIFKTANFSVVAQPDFTITQTSTPSLTAAPGGGAYGTITFTVSGGVYPATFTLGTLPTGIGLNASTPATQTLSAPGTISWQINANSSAPAGALTTTTAVNDSGISASGVPAGSQNLTTNFSVVGQIDLSPAITITNTFQHSGQSLTSNVVVSNTGNQPSANTDTLTCTFGSAGNVFTGTLPSIAGNSSTTVAVNFTIPTDQYPSANYVCTVSADPGEGGAALSNNSFTTPVTLSSNFDLEVLSLGALPPAFQQGQSATLTATLKNIGTDTVPAGWGFNILLAGSSVSSASSQAALAPNATVPVSVTITVPSPGVAPYDNTFTTGYTVTVTPPSGDANSSNDSLSVPARLVDFTLTTANFGGPVNAIATRSLTITNAATVLPATYPLPVSITYNGMPAGLNASGTSGNFTGINITGSPSTTGSALITPTATVNGVMHTAASLQLSVGPEIAISNGSVALLSNGPVQTLTSNFTGGVYPLTISLGSLPNGVSLSGSSSSQILSAPGSISWNLVADNTSVPGSGTINVNASDAGTSQTSGSSSYLVTSLGVNSSAAYSIGGQANYQITSATITNHPQPPQGASAFQIGETVTFDVTVANVGNASPSGPITVGIACSPTCPAATSTINNAPLAGGTATTTISMPVNTGLTAGTSYAGSLNINGAPPQSTTADDSLSGFNFDVYDFTVTNPATMVQNIPIGTNTANFTVNVNQIGTAKSLPMSATGTVSGAVLSASAGTTTSTVTIDATNVTGPQADNITVTGTNFGVSRATTQAVQYYSANWAFNNGASVLGTSSSNPLPLPIGSSVGFNLKLNGSFQGAATLVLPGGSSPTVTSTVSTANANDLVDLTLNAAASANSNAPFQITISANIPNTNPAQSVSTTIWVVTQAVPDLSITSVTGTGNFNGRSFSLTDPLLAGESGSFNVVVANTGAAPSSGGQQLLVHLYSATGQNISNGVVTVPSVPSSSSTTVGVNVLAPDPIADLAGGSLVFEVLADQGNGSVGPEQNTANNTFSIPANFSGWSLQVSGNGVSDATPLALSGSTGTAFATVKLVTSLSGSVAGSNYQIKQGAATNHTSLLASSSTYTPGQDSNSIGISYSGVGVGPYNIQVIGQLIDSGLASSSQRGAQIYMAGTGTGSVPTVTITSDRGNASAGNALGCTGACAPLQINGIEAEKINLTATRTPVGNGTNVDFVFTDDTGIVSNTDATGTITSNQIITATYNTPSTVYFAAEGQQGSIDTSAGSKKVVISAAAIESVPRGFPTLGTVGNQQTTLYFNIGDLAITVNGGACLVLPASTPTNFSVNFLPLNGFNAGTLTWSWNTNGNALDPGTTSGTSTYSGGTYSPINATFTNIGPNQASGGAVATLQVSIDNGEGGGPVTEFFDVPYSPNSTCNTASAARIGGNNTSLIHGTWKRGGAAGSSVTGTVRAASAKLPDVQIVSKDITFSPSLPKAGDTINVRFRITNNGDADVTGVPVALQINGQTVASETFDVRAGSSTLGGLSWTAPAAAIAADGVSPADTNFRETSRSFRTAPNRTSAGMGAGAMRVSLAAMKATLVIDPAGTIREKSALNKSAALAGFAVRPTVQQALATNVSYGRVMLEVAANCVGYRVSTAMPVPCESGNLDIMVEDEGAGRYAFVSQTGNIADLGFTDAASASLTNASFTSRVVMQTGHAYAVQATDGSVTVFGVSRVINPRLLTAAARAKFHVQARKLISALGGTNGAVETGDVSGHDDSAPLLFLELLVRNQ